MAYLRSSSLLGLVGQRPPQFPYGIGLRRGLAGLVGQPKPQFPFGLGIGQPFPKVVAPRGGPKKRSLGCACSKRLGQDDFGPGEQITGSMYSDPSFANSSSSSSGAIPVFNNPSMSPLSTGGQIATTPASAIAPGPAQIYQIPSGASSAPSSFSSYLPYMVLGGGALILIAALKRK